jgi:hypothetical protein
VGAFYYHGNNQQNFGASVFPFTGTISEPFYRAGGDLRFRYKSKFELYGVGMVGHDDNHFVDTVGQTIVNAKPITFAGGFVTGNYYIFGDGGTSHRPSFVSLPAVRLIGPG